MGLIEYLEPRTRILDERGRVIVSRDPEHDLLAGEDAALERQRDPALAPDRMIGRLIEVLNASRASDRSETGG